MPRKNENLGLKYVYSILISHLLVISRSKRSIRKWNRRMSNFLTHIYIAELAEINYEQMIILFEYFWVLASHNAWKVSKYWVFSGPYFPVFGLNTGKYGPEITPYLDTFHAVSHCHVLPIISV